LPVLKLGRRWLYLRRSRHRPCACSLTLFKSAYSHSQIHALPYPI
jgi:hypothetical protein